MASGVKIQIPTLQGEYTTESLYEAIKGSAFTAGQPSLTKQGLAYLITFPALDSQNQVQIIAGGIGGKPSSTVVVQKNEEAGVRNLAANTAINMITGGLFGLGSMAGKKAKTCEELVDKTAEELSALGL